MPGRFLTGFFHPVLQKFGYFITNFNTLKRLLIAFAIILPFVSSSQGNIEFIENKGQWDSRVRFKGQINNGSLYIREGGFTVVQHNAQDMEKFSHLLHEQGPEQLRSGKVPGTIRSHAFNVDFIGASPQMEVVADKPLSTYNNYFIGNDPSKWASECRIFQGVTFRNVYPNVDVRYYTDKGFLKYDIVVRPGGDVSRIALKYDGVEKLQVKNRELLINTSLGELKESSPYTYQAATDGRREVSSKYVVKGNELRFDVREYDRNATLVIDPVIIFCSFSGSTTDNWGFTATYGPDGSMYGGGIVFSPGGFPVSPGAFQVGFGGGNIDIGIIRLSANGANRIYATYIGGDGDEQPHSLIADGQGNLFIAGRSASFNYPVVNNGTVAGAAYDIVVSKLNAAGTALLGSRKIGGTADDGVNISSSRTGTNSLVQNYGDDGRSEVILDGSGNVIVASCTKSTNFPVTPGAYQTVAGGEQDGVLLKFNSSLATLQFATYLGGSGNDAAYVAAVAPNGSIYVGGGTVSGSSFLPGTQAGSLGPTANGSIDGFVAILNSAGSAVIRSAFIGTSGIDQVYGVQFDRFGFPYIMGQTTGDWQVVNATYSSGGKQFIAKLEPDLSSYVYSTKFGTASTNPNISPIAFLVDRCENVYISGWGGFIGNDNAFNSAGTNGLPVTPDAFKPTTDGKDMYFFVLKKDATGQLFGSFFGETNPPNAGLDHVDGGTSRFDQNGVIYQAICGNCSILGNQPVYPVTPGAWSTTNNATTGSGCNLTMLKIAMNLAGVEGGVQSAIDGVPRDSTGCIPLTVDFTDTVQVAQSYEWYFGDGSPMLVTNTPNATHTYTAVGTFQVMMVAIDPNTCNVRDTSYVTIRAGDIEATLAIDATKLPPCEDYRYQFDNLSSAPASTPFNASSFIWDFGDGSPRVTTGAGPVFHNYAAPGTYNVKLILRDDRYCNAPDSVELQLSVARNVEASFETPPTGCVPYEAIFDNTTDAGETYLWDFGDGNTSTDFEPTHIYTTPGIYHVTLIASNPNTCNLTDTFEFDIEVFPNPVADFSFAPIPAEENTPTTFTNLSSPDAVNFKWVFGDGDSLITTSRLSVTHQYNATGTYTACLTAYNAAGCPHTVCKEVEARIIPLVGVPNAFTPNSGDDNSVVRVEGFGIGKMTFTIWNRWGQKVFETNNRFQGWDGKVKGVVQPMDVYAYTLNVEFTDGTKQVLKGDITLIR